MLVRVLASAPTGSRIYLAEVLIGIETHTAVICIPLSQ